MVRLVVHVAHLVHVPLWRTMTENSVGGGHNASSVLPGEGTPALDSRNAHGVSDKGRVLTVVNGSLSGWERAYRPHTVLAGKDMLGIHDAEIAGLLSDEQGLDVDTREDTVS